MRSLEKWITDNLSYQPGYYYQATHYNSFRLKVFPLMLLVAAVAVATMWYREENLMLITNADRVAYPLMLLVCLFGAALLKYRPNSLRVIMVVIFVVYVFHLLVVYYQEMWIRFSGQPGSSYEITIIALWLPLGYVGSFVFFSPRWAFISSITLYLAVILPQLIVFGSDSDDVEKQIAMAIMLSQPVYIAALIGVAQLKRYAHGTHNQAQILSNRAHSDSLTGLLNRHAMREVLEIAINSQQSGVRNFSLIMFDVDNFKQINDKYGHPVGDEVLIRLAKEIQDCLRTSDLVARWGGEEFVMLLLDECGQAAFNMAERIRAKLESLDYPLVGQVTVSLGITEYSKGDDVHALIHRADMALYKAKRGGRNRVEVFE